MKHEFPIIKHIDDVRHAIAARDEFVIAERPEFGYSVVNYNVAFHDTFDIDYSDVVDNYGRAIPKGIIRRECRGLMFDMDGGLISRPAHKFFNIDEKPETSISKIEISKPHLILDKLDGSFIRPFRTKDGVFRVGTKMGETDTAALAKPFFEMENYRTFAEWCLDRHLTPVFEFMSRKQRIVIDYGDIDKLVLLFVRDNQSGRYIKYQ